MINKHIITILEKGGSYDLRIDNIPFFGSHYIPDFSNPAPIASSELPDKTAKWLDFEYKAVVLSRRRKKRR